MVRGVCTGDYLSCASGEADVDEECYYPSQAHNACTRVEAIPAVASRWTQSCTLHGLECPQVQAGWSKIVDLIGVCACRIAVSFCWHCYDPLCMAPKPYARDTAPIRLTMRLEHHRKASEKTTAETAKIYSVVQTMNSRAGLATSALRGENQKMLQSARSNKRRSKDIVQITYAMSYHVLEPLPR